MEAGAIRWGSWVCEAGNNRPLLVVDFEGPYVQVAWRPGAGEEPAEVMFHHTALRPHRPAPSA